MGVDVAFLAIIHTPNLLNLFLAFIFLLCLNNMIYYFLQHVSLLSLCLQLKSPCFLCFLPCFMLRSTSLHAYMSRSTYVGFYSMFSYVLCLFQSQVDVRVTCSHVFMILLAMPCLDLCVSYIYFHDIWLDPCLHMHICLDSCS